MSAHTPGEWRAVDGRGQYAEEVHASGPRGARIVVARVGGGPNNRKANARLIAAAPDGLRAAELAYLTLLQLPHDGFRARNQATLCALLDFIAAATGRDPESVQNEFEQRATTGDAP